MNIPYWYELAPCAQVGPELFFPDDSEVPYDARRICAPCPYKAPCAIGAAQRGEKYGVWGGLTYRGLLKIRRELEDASPVRLAEAPAMRQPLDETFGDAA